MASRFLDHEKLIIFELAKGESITQIAAKLTKLGCPSSRANLSLWIKARATKAASRRELVQLLSGTAQQSQQPITAPETPASAPPKPAAAPCVIKTTTPPKTSPLPAPPPAAPKFSMTPWMIKALEHIECTPKELISYQRVPEGGREKYLQHIGEVLKDAEVLPFYKRPGEVLDPRNT